MILCYCSSFAGFRPMGSCSRPVKDRKGRQLSFEGIKK